MTQKQLTVRSEAFRFASMPAKLNVTTRVSPQAHKFISDLATKHDTSISTVFRAMLHVALMRMDEVEKRVKELIEV